MFTQWVNAKKLTLNVSQCNVIWFPAHRQKNMLKFKQFYSNSLSMLSKFSFVKENQIGKKTLPKIGNQNTLSRYG